MPRGRPDSPPAGAELAAKEPRACDERRRSLCPGSEARDELDHAQHSPAREHEGRDHDCRPRRPRWC
eukprot:5046721-Prymnesium_polylepis.1